MTKLIRMAALAGALALTACAGAPPWSKQDHAGITTLELGENGCLPDTFFRSGKETEGVAARVTCHPDGTVTAEVSASGVKAFNGQGFRAEVEKLSVEMQAEVAPDFLDALVEVAKKHAGLL